MIEYEMRKMGDGMLGDPEKQFPQAKSAGVVSLGEIAEKIQHRSTYTTSDVTGLVAALADAIAEANAQGQSVKIDGLGLFRPILGLVDKAERHEWTDSAGRVSTGKNVKLKTVGFRPDGALIRAVTRNLDLKRIGGLGEENKPQTTVAERAQLARQYLAEKAYMHVADYAKLCKLSYTTAHKELKRLADDPTSDLTTDGQGPSKVYVLKK